VKAPKGAVLDLAARMKGRPHGFVGALRGDTVACFFEKPSTRTRVSFAAAAERLGMLALLLRPDELQLGRGETLGLHPGLDLAHLHGAEGGLPGGDHRQVVVMQLSGPARMRLVLRVQLRAQRRREAALLTGVAAYAAAQSGDRVAARVFRRVVPALKGGEAKLDRLTADRVAPALGCQSLQRLLQFARLRRRGQQRAAATWPACLPQPAAVAHHFLQEPGQGCAVRTRTCTLHAVLR